MKYIIFIVLLPLAIVAFVIGYICQAYKIGFRSGQIALNDLLTKTFKSKSDGKLYVKL